MSFAPRSLPSQQTETKIYSLPQSAIQVIGVFVRCAPKSPTVRCAHLTCHRAAGPRQATIFAVFCVNLSSRLARDAALPFRKTANQLPQICCFSTLGAIPKNKFWRLPGVYIDPYKNFTAFNFLPLVCCKLPLDICVTDIVEFCCSTWVFCALITFCSEYWSYIEPD